jgi:hypothetical protein
MSCSLRMTGNQRRKALFRCLITIGKWNTYVTKVTSSNTIRVTRRIREGTLSGNSVHVSEGCEHLAVIHAYHSAAHWPKWATETPRWAGNPTDTKLNNSTCATKCSAPFSNTEAHLLKVLEKETPSLQHYQRRPLHVL